MSAQILAGAEQEIESNNQTLCSGQREWCMFVSSSRPHMGNHVERQRLDACGSWSIFALPDAIKGG